MNKTAAFCGGYHGLDPHNGENLTLTHESSIPVLLFPRPVHDAAASRGCVVAPCAASGCERHQDDRRETKQDHRFDPCQCLAPNHRPSACFSVQTSPEHSIQGTRPPTTRITSSTEATPRSRAI